MFFFFKILIFWVVREVKSALEIVFSIPSHRDQIIPLFVGHFKFQAVSWYMPENSASHHGWKTKKVLHFRSSKTAFALIFSQYFIQTYSVFFLLNSACWHEQNLNEGLQILVFSEKCICDSLFKVSINTWQKLREIT